jgi:hypothetical protein
MKTMARDILSSMSRAETEDEVKRAGVAAICFVSEYLNIFGDRSTAELITKLTTETSNVSSHCIAEASINTTQNDTPIYTSELCTSPDSAPELMASAPPPVNVSGLDSNTVIDIPADFDEVLR